MRLKRMAEEFDKLPKEIRHTVLEIIDLKTDEDMKEVIAEIKGVKSEQKIILWVVGIAMAILLAIIALKK